MTKFAVEVLQEILPARSSPCIDPSRRPRLIANGCGSTTGHKIISGSQQHMENEMGSMASLAANREILRVSDAVFDLLRDHHGCGAMKSFSRLLDPSESPVIRLPARSLWMQQTLCRFFRNRSASRVYRFFAGRRDRGHGSPGSRRVG